MTSPENDTVELSSLFVKCCRCRNRATVLVVHKCGPAVPACAKCWEKHESMMRYFDIIHTTGLAEVEAECSVCGAQNITIEHVTAVPLP